MADTNNPVEESPVVDWNPTPEQNDRYLKHYELFREYEQNRNQTFRFFKDRTLIEYIKDSVDRMNEYALKPEYKEEWQNNTFDPVTRNKVMTVLSKIASSRMKPEVSGGAKKLMNFKNIRERAMLMGSLLESANKHNNDARQIIWEMYSAMSEGTVIGYEDWKKDMRTVNYVKDYNPDTGEIETDEVTVDAWDDVFGELVPVKEFFPETVWVNSIDALHRCFRVKAMKFSLFQDMFGKFKNSKDVMPMQDYYTDTSEVPWGLPTDADPKNVFVMQHYDEIKDKLGIWANGVEIYYGPMPWNHKKLPFWSTQFEIIHPDFLYGKSMPDKLMSMQDMNNGVFNSMLDQILMALKSPIFVDGNIDDLDDDYLEPGRIYQTDPGTQVQKGVLGNVDQTSFQMLQLIKRSMEESSVSAQAQGIATGGRKTRAEVEVLQEGALNLASLFLQIMETSMGRKYELRLANILQYYTMPNNRDDEKLRFKFIVLEDTKLTNGRNGKRLIQITDDAETQPTKAEMVGIAENEEGKEFDPATSTVEPMVVTRQYIMDKEYSFEIVITPNSSVKESEQQKKRNDVTFYQMTAENPMIDQPENLRDLADAFDKDPSIVKEAPKPGKEQGGIEELLAQANQAGGGGKPRPQDVDTSLL